ncbi:MAG: hypothetical protein AAF798_04575 [Bacteroidota bacterium]
MSVGNPTISEFIHLFQKLDLKSKVFLLKELTSLLDEGIEVDTVVTNPSAEAKKKRDQVIDELFGAWENEDELTEANIIQRTISNREIDLN